MGVSNKRVDTAPSPAELDNAVQTVYDAYTWIDEEMYRREHLKE